MDFEVGMIQGENYYFSANHSWPSVKLMIESEKIVLASGFKLFSFDRDKIKRLSEFQGFCWIFARGIRVEHTVENCPRFIVFWAFDLTEIKRILTENGFAVATGSE